MNHHPPTSPIREAVGPRVPAVALPLLEEVALLLPEVVALPLLEEVALPKPLPQKLLWAVQLNKVIHLFLPPPFLQPLPVRLYLQGIPLGSQPPRSMPQ